MTTIKSFAELSSKEIENLQIGDPIACDICYEPGIWDPKNQHSNGISESNYMFEDDNYPDLRICDSCERMRDDKLVTRQAFEEATTELAEYLMIDLPLFRVDIILAFWEEVGAQMPDLTTSMSTLDVGDMIEYIASTVRQSLRMINGPFRSPVEIEDLIKSSDFLKTFFQAKNSMNSNKHDEILASDQ